MAAKGSVAKHADPNARIRMLDGKVVKACKYMGSAIGRGNYMTGEVDGQIVCDEAGIPLPYKHIGSLVRVNK